MHCPTLAELPRPLLKKNGWPWVEGSDQLPETMPGGRPWPRISIVTPSYNQGHFLEETIRSVLLQGYSDLEYMIMDAGSTDDSLEIIRRYDRWLAYWKSEPDRGQAHAVNKGWHRATGDIYAWINSDDLLMPGALGVVADILSGNKTDWVCGAAAVIDRQGRTMSVEKPRPHLTIENMIATWQRPSYSYPQMSSFVSEKVVTLAGPLRENLHYVMDHEYWLRLVSLGFTPTLTEKELSLYRMHRGSKTMALRHRFIQEAVRVGHEYRDRLGLKDPALGRSLAHGRALAALERMKESPANGSRLAVTAGFLKNLLHSPRLLCKRAALEALWRQWTAPPAKRK